MLPNVSNFSKHSDQLIDHHDAQRQCDNTGHTLPELPVGSTVGYHNHLTHRYDIGIVTEHDARLYIILMENGTHVSQNCIDLKWTYVHFEPKANKTINLLPQTQPVV